MRLLTILCFLALAISSSRAQTAQVQRIDVTEYGIYTLSAVDNGQTAAGITTRAVSNIRLAVSTRTVPMQKGVKFGFRYTVIGTPKGVKVPLRMVLLLPSPGFLKPGAPSPILRDEYVHEEIVGNSTFHDYSLDDPWELIPGNWTFEIWYGNQKLVSQTFNVAKQ
jgi:hypothetical protein